MAGKHVIVAIAWLGAAACSSSSTSQTGSGSNPGDAVAGGGGGDGASGTPPAGDPPSSGGTLTFQSVGRVGSYPSRRDPAIGPCDANNADGCCLATKQITSDALTPLDQDLIFTMRGPMFVNQIAVYQPAADAKTWARVSSWDASAPTAPSGLAFAGNGTDTAGFPGSVGTECLVNVSTSKLFACGPGSDPYCPPQAKGKNQYYGWEGSKLFVVQASMPHADAVPNRCSKDNTGGWYDAPWFGFSIGELVRAGSFVSCQCYSKTLNSQAADGCGQFNAFEVVNDNNSSQNFDLFSTDIVNYGGYYGEGPAGKSYDISSLAADVDLIDKTTHGAATMGGISAPDPSSGKPSGPRAAFRRPEHGFRYFIMLFDVASRTVQLAIVHPGNVPAALAPLMPALPDQVDASTVDAVRALRLPRYTGTR